MGNLWTRFDSIATSDEVEVAKAKFKPLDSGNYDVVLEGIEAGEAKSGLPMLKVKFRTTSNRLLFVNQMLQNLNNPEMTAINIANAVVLVSSLMNEDIVYTGMEKLAETIEQCANDYVGMQYKINVSYGDKDTDMSFPKVRVLSDYESIAPLDDDDETPF